MSKAGFFLRIFLISAGASLSGLSFIGKSFHVSLFEVSPDVGPQPHCLGQVTGCLPQPLRDLKDLPWAPTSHRVNPKPHPGKGDPAWPVPVLPPPSLPPLLPPPHYSSNPQSSPMLTSLAWLCSLTSFRFLKPAPAHTTFLLSPYCPLTYIHFLPCVYFLFPALSCQSHRAVVFIYFYSCAPSAQCGTWHRAVPCPRVLMNEGTVLPVLDSIG